jgi:CRISPR-associated endonuclease/helicase Cas3
MENSFKKLTGNKIYPYQKQVANTILNGNNAIVCAPTGAGKTWAALFPYIWAKKQGKTFADRLIYVLPLRTLANSIYEDTVLYCRKVFDVKTYPEERTNTANEIIITIQTGEQKNDPFFEGDIIFTTVDQCLSSYLNCPVSLPQRVGNINAGALLGSIIVFDEFHLLEPDRTMATALEMLDRIKSFSQFVIMSATLSQNSLSSIKEIINGEIIKLTQDEVLNLPSHKEKKRTYRWMKKTLTAEDVLIHHEGKRSIVILNTVTKAQDIFKELKNRLKGSDTKILLLHSRFYSEDRKKTENELNNWLGKRAEKTDVILVTTQVIEAGIDISADNLHTEIAPLNSVVQRAGRCARYEGIRGVGTVWIYELEKNEKGTLKLGPYRDSIQSSLIENTRAYFKQLPVEGKILNFEDELQMLDSVHLEIEKRYFEAYKQNQHDLKMKVHEAMDGNNEAAVRELVRDVSSVNVIVSNNPHSLRFNKDKWPRMLSVPRSNLYNLTRFFESGRDSDKIVAWYPVENSNIIDDENAFSFGWTPISSKDTLKNVSWLVVLNPQYASYSSEIGLQIGVSGTYEEPKYFDRPIAVRYNIRYETYCNHVKKVISECQKMEYLYKKVLPKIATHYNLSTEKLKEMLELCCAFHDMGKLSEKWQGAIREWQKYKNQHKLSDEPIAHSDYDPEIDFEEKKKFPKQPSHAAEGAYSIEKWLIDYLGEDYAVVLCTAIARHHGAFTESLADFSLIDNTSKWIKKTLPDISNMNITLDDKPDNITQKKFKNDLLCFSKNSDDEKLWPLYVFLIRWLRLSDQKSQKWSE